MFTGIVEAVGIVRHIETQGSNRSIWLESPISSTLRPDQSVSHNGACLTVEEVRDSSHKVTAITETLKKTNLAELTTGNRVNLERCLSLASRVDGHFVQGHVDTTAECTRITDSNGSWEFEFEFPAKFAELVIEKGSIAINGISLTTYTVKKKSFRAAIIPYTFQHTNIGEIKKGSLVNLEFDMIGKYVLRRLSLK